MALGKALATGLRAATEAPKRNLDLKNVNLQNTLREKYPDVEIDLFGDSIKGYELSKIKVPKNLQSQGLGTQVMDDLVSIADAQGAKVKLTPDTAFGGTSVSRLKKFYKNFGFVENKGRNKDFTIKNTMYRESLSTDAPKRKLTSQYTGMGAVTAGGAFLVAPEESQAGWAAKFARLGFYGSQKESGGLVLYTKEGQKVGDYEYWDEAFAEAMNQSNKVPESGAVIDAPTVTKAVESDYRGGHTAPIDPEYASMDDMSRTYPADIYSANGTRYYGDGQDFDQETMDIIQSVYRNPDAEVTIYRAVPRWAGDEIQVGDWVTPNINYARLHGEGLGEYKILKSKVKAGEIRTEGNSIHEFGYAGPLLDVPAIHPDAPKALKAQGFDTDTPYYHGTESNVDEVDLQEVDIGFHVGTKAHANNRLVDKNVGKAKMYRDDADVNIGANIMPLYINKGKILDMPDVGDWKDSELVISALEDIPEFRGKFDEAYEELGVKDQYEYTDDWRNSPENRELLNEINEVIRGAGYNTIRYKNYVEMGTDLDDSFIVLDPKNVRSVHAQGLDFQTGKLLASGSPIGIAAVLGTSVYTSDSEAIPLSRAGKIVIQAYHGTPHKVDRFRSDKINTGEGAQAYGYGLYFADRRGVAVDYRDKLSKNREGQDRVYADGVEVFGTAQVMGRDIADGRMSFKQYEEYIKSYPKPSDVPKEYIDALEILRGKEIKIDNGGNLYEVEIDATPDELLDWDKPLKEQSKKVQDAVLAVRRQAAKATQADDEKLLNELFDGDIPKYEGPGFKESTLRMSGRQAYYNSAPDATTQKAASDALLKQGIKGIQFLDGVSRNKPLKDIKNKFLDELPEDADFDEVMELVEEGYFSPDMAEVLRALEADDFLGFDYPSQGISAAYGDNIGDYDPSQRLLDAIAATRTDLTRNYVVFDDKLINIITENDVLRGNQ